MTVYNDGKLRFLIEYDGLIQHEPEWLHAMGRTAKVGPASVDLHLGTTFRRMRKRALLDGQPMTIDTADDARYWHPQLTRTPEDHVILCPGDFVLGTTAQIVRLPDDACARLFARSTCGRMALKVAACAGFGDPGFTGAWTVELSNHGTGPIAIRPGDRLFQMVLFAMGERALKPYGTEGVGQYQGQVVATLPGGHTPTPPSGRRGEVRAG